MTTQYSKSELLDLSDQHPIIAFDGVCNLCDGFVQWLIKRDEDKVFRYVTLQSGAGKVLQMVSASRKESVILVYNRTIYTYSDVALKSMEILSGFWRVLSYFSIMPKSIRDAVYHFVASNRYKWFGKKAECMVPSAEVRSLFL